MDKWKIIAIIFICLFVCVVIAFITVELLKRENEQSNLEPPLIVDKISVQIPKGIELCNIPIYINNYNQVTLPKRIISILQTFGYKNIFILDNNSDSPMTLEWYEQLDTGVHLIRLGKNCGPHALWTSGIFQQHELGSKYFVYTDPDVVPLTNCKDFLLDFMEGLLQNPKVQKVGFSLSCGRDLFVSKWEMEHGYFDSWDEHYYTAATDTTFALYRPGSYEFNHSGMRSKRSWALHVPWDYAVEPDSAPDDYLYYILSCRRNNDVQSTFSTNDFWNESKRMKEIKERYNF